MFKFRGRMWILLLSIMLLTSCSISGLINPSGADSYTQEPGNAADIRETENQSESGSHEDNLSEDGSANEITLEVLNAETEDESIPAGQETHAGNSSRGNKNTEKSAGIPDSKPVKMEIKLYFADREAVSSGKPGQYGFVTPTVRKVPATSGILKYTISELIKGPLPEEEGLDPVIPATVKINKVIIKDKVAVIDFNKALLTDHPGGTLGGTITRHAIVFTASQFDSVDGVMVTVEDNPWNDGHFIWDYPIYADELLNSMKNND
ncbi:MAG TPA: GerMN domain-containing protein [Clostridiales bacterium]|nr:GerMN domain-containing protein [Clostridiales bacterium]